MKKIGMSLLAVAFCAVAFVGVSRAADEKVTGYVIDEKCSTMPKMMGNVECAKKCADGGSKLVIAADKGGKVYAVDNQDVLEGPRRPSRHRQWRSHRHEHSCRGCRHGAREVTARVKSQSNHLFSDEGRRKCRPFSLGFRM